MGKQTFLINPTKIDFIRENVYRGSPIVKNEKEAQELINEFYTYKSIKEFEKKQLYRDEIIKDVIEYGDGKNHIRAANEVIKIYNLPEKKVKYPFNLYKHIVKQISKILLNKTVLKNRWQELNYKSDFAKNYQKMYEKVINV